MELMEVVEKRLMVVMETVEVVTEVVEQQRSMIVMEVLVVE